MKRSMTIMIAGLLAVAAAAGAWHWYGGRQASRDAATPLLAQVQRGDVEDLVSATGTLQPRDYVDVGAQVSGQLEKIHVEVGSVVKEGELLAEIDSTLYRARVDATRASLENQRAQMLDRQAQLDLATLNHKRQKNLMAAEATTAEQLQTAEATLRSAKAQLAALQAQIRQSESTLRAEEAQLNYAKIYAPMSGTVVSITARQGQTLNTNQQAPVILQIADLSTMTVQAQVSEADVNRLREGMSVWFTTLGGQDRRWQGALRKVEPTPVVQNNVVLYNALFDVPNPNRTLMPQMTAQVFFVVASARDTLTVPVAALSGLGRRPQADPAAGASTAGGPGAGQPGAGQPEVGQSEASVQASGAPSADAPARDDSPRGRSASVTVVSSGGETTPRRIVVGVTNRVQAQVLSGLAEGEQVQVGVQRAGGQAGPAGAGGGRGEAGHH
ncbi:MAG TPA: efflux RND transporter periplasmic adaptor subunit, partial [Burkholderiaceae bacterium]|nr:efflux RND transporter periplasmic adaptor subunit [Burkholderiaceae bacterium]